MRPVHWITLPGPPILPTCLSGAAPCWTSGVTAQSMRRHLRARVPATEPQQFINHYGLNVRDPKAREFLLQNMEQFLFQTPSEV